MTNKELRKEFEDKFLMRHGEYGTTIITTNGIDSVTEWWLSKFDSHTAELKKKIEGKRMKVVRCDVTDHENGTMCHNCENGISECYYASQRQAINQTLDECLSELNHQ